MRNFISLLLGLMLVSQLPAQSSGTALIRHAPTLNGSVQGSIQQMTAENATLNGGASVTGDLLVSGTPTVQLNGNPTYGGTLDGSGAATPTTHKVTLNGGASLGHVVRRTDPVALPVVADPPPPAGTRNVSLNNSSQSPGDFTTLKNLTLNGNVGAIAVPPGAYGDFTANGSSSFVLGVTGNTTPAIYAFQHLTLNGSSHLDVVGPVVITLANGMSANGSLGASANPGWLTLNLAAGGLTLNGSVSVYGHVTASSGAVTINGSSQLVGGLVSDRLTINGNGLLRLLAPPAANQPPTVSLTAPTDGSTYTAPASITLVANAADSDGNVARVEFYQGAVKLGEATTAPYTLAVSGLAAGSYTYTARAIDNLGASTDSAGITLTIASPNQPPVVSLTAPADGTLLTTPATLALTATASDPDGSIGKVEFFQNGAKEGEDFTAPYEWTVSGLTTGTYAFSARAYDLQNLSAPSGTATVTVVAANQAPVVELTAPSDGSAYVAPAAFTLSATASDTDGTITKVELYQDGAKLGEDAFAPFEFTVSGLSAGTYHYLARATDNTGSATDSAPVTVTVSSPNMPPVVTLTAPADDATFTLPATLTLAATATDADGNIAKVEFYSGTTLLGTGTLSSSNGFTFPLPLTSPGIYVLTAKATDNAGMSTISAPVTVTVTDNGVPFLANFEPAEGYLSGLLNGQKGWSVDGSASIVTAPAYRGQQAVSVAPGTPPALLVRTFVNSDPRVTFVDFFAQPAASATASAGVLLDTDAARVALTGTPPTGILQAYNGDGSGGGSWISTDKGPVIDAPGKATDWLRLTVRADYATKKWDLYFNGQMIAADLGFIDNAKTAFAGLGLSGHSTLTTGFDDLLVAFDNPLFVDADHDGMADAWESAHGLNPALTDRDADPDGDGLTNMQEYILGTNPNAADTDGDGLPDKQELTLGTNPRAADSDGDGLPDGWEQSHGFNPLSAADATFDSDGDGHTNLAEYQAGTDPADFYNGQIPLLTIVSGNNQTGIIGEFNVQPLIISVSNAAGTVPLAHAPVIFTVQSGGGHLALTHTGTPVLSSTLNLTTDAEGQAQVYYQQPDTVGATSQIQAVAGGALVMFQSDSLANQPPVVALTAPATGDSFGAPTAMWLRATAGDPDGTIAKVEFFQGTTKLGEALSAPFEFHWVNVGIGSYTLTARATDDRNAQTISSAVVVQVNPVTLAPVVELLDPENGITCLHGSSVTLRAQGHELDGRLAKIEFYVDGELFDTRTFAAGTDTTLPVTAAWSAAVLGSHTFMARAHDLAGASAESAPATIQVTASPPPAVSLSAPANNSRFDLGVAINFRASVGGGTGSVTKVEYYADGLLLGSATTSPYQLPVSSLAVGTHRLRARVYDDVGGVGISAVRTTTILPHVPYAVDFTAAEGFSTGLQRGLHGWNATTGAAWVADVGDASGNRALVLRATTTAAPVLTQFFTPVASDDTNPLFVDMVARLPAGDAAPTAPSVWFGFSRVALVREGSVGRLYVFDSDGESGPGWTPTNATVTLGSDGVTSDWIHLMVRRTANRWDLSFNGRLIAVNVRISTTFGQIDLNGSSTADLAVDRLSVGYVNPLFEDLDRDGMDDAWEMVHGLNPALNDREDDLDQDGLSNIRELLLGTNPDRADTDGDGLPDGWESAHGYDLLHAELPSILGSDADQDGLTLLQEAFAGTDPDDADSDHDGIPDGAEIQLGLNPIDGEDGSTDSDGDGVSNRDEYLGGTDPKDYYNGSPPTVASLLPASGELGSDGLFSILVTRSDGTPLANAPVTFTTSEEGSRMVLLPADPVEYSSVVVRSGPDGVAKVYIRGRQP